MSVEDDDEWPQPPLMVEQLSDKDPHARLELLWHNFAIAMRHVARLQALEAQADVGVSPMHVAQKDETLASIARVRPVWMASHRWRMACSIADYTCPTVEGTAVSDPCKQRKGHYYCCICLLSLMHLSCGMAHIMHLHVAVIGGSLYHFCVCAGMSSDCSGAAKNQPRYAHFVAVWRLHRSSETLPTTLVLHTTRRLLGKHCKFSAHTTWQAATAQRRCSGAHKVELIANFPRRFCTC